MANKKKSKEVSIDLEAKENYPQILAAAYVRRLIEGKLDENSIMVNQDYKGVMLLTVDVRKAWGKNNELRKALIIPANLREDLLDKDVENGAYPFKDLIKVSEVDKESKVTFIRVSNREDGYKAVEYLASKLKDTNDSFFETGYVDPRRFSLESYDPDNGVSYENIIPIVTLNQVLYGNTQSPFSIPVNDMSFIGMPNQPFNQGAYWTNHSGPIIIINDDILCSDDALNDAISKLKKSKSRVYVINVEQAEEGTNYICEEGEMNEEFTFCESIARSRYLKALISHNASVFVVPKDDDYDYKQKILSGLCYKYDITIPEDFPVNELIRLVDKGVDDMRSDFLDKLLFREKHRMKAKTLSCDMLYVLGRIDKRDSRRLKGWKLLDSLAGMESTKKEIVALVNALKLNKARRKRGLKNEPIVACLFAGAPGTAKTTVAQALADILLEEGLLPNGRFTSISGSGLQGEYVGQTSGKVRRLVYGDGNGNGNDVILIDECYSLSQSLERNSPYAAEALAELCVLLTEAAEREDKLFIFAGYGGTDSTDENNYLKTFLNSNPGIKSRISAVISFPSFSARETADVFMKICQNDEYCFDSKDTDLIKKEVEEYFKERVSDPAFGNGREARNLLSETMRIHAELINDKSIDEITDEELKTITVDEVHRAIDSLRNMEAARQGKTSRKISLIK